MSHTPKLEIMKKIAGHGWPATGAPLPIGADAVIMHGASPDDLVATEFETYADHRMVHAAAIMALRVPGLGVTDLECVSKTMPDFEADWHTAVGA